METVMAKAQQPPADSEMTQNQNFPLPHVFLEDSW